MLKVTRSTFKSTTHFSIFTCYFRRILAYLIPLRILKGHLPSNELLQRFPVLDEIFSPFIAAIRIGDVQGYDEALERWEPRLLQLNLWLSLEKARELCLRGLFRRV
jgi:hypothetical protein